MKKNDIADLKSKTVDELTRMLLDLREEVEKLKKEDLLKKTKNSNLVKMKKKDLARVITFLSMKKVEAPVLEVMVESKTKNKEGGKVK